MFEFRRLYCEYVELHAPLSSGLNELLVACSAVLKACSIQSIKVYAYLTSRNLVFHSDTV